MQEVLDFIAQNWKNTIRYLPNDEGRMIGLPKPYTVPTVADRLQAFYYWDTYFTNIGLLLSGQTDQAINNAENMAFLIHKYGFMPNANQTNLLTRSQPPFFSQIVRDIFEQTQNADWLKSILPAVEKEYEFWQTQRISPSGLNCYGSQINWQQTGPERMKEIAQGLCRRCHLEMPQDLNTVTAWAKHIVCLCESGWDCTSRFGLEGYLYNPVDLNALLYQTEQNLAYFCGQLNEKEKPDYAAAANKRKQKMQQFMWNERLGAFNDYHFEKNSVSSFASVACFFPLYAGLCSQEQAKATVLLLQKLENPFGVACTENSSDLMQLQWDYPHGWACLHYITIKGLENYGFKEQAKRTAQKYCTVVERNFVKTGNLWEKYNTVTGELSVTKEYETPSMMGWSAGVYLYCNKILAKKEL